MSDEAINTAARFGEIPFVEFTKELVTGVFDSLVEAHILQMEEFATFANSMTQSLSTYINNTIDGVSFDQVSDFILNYELPGLEDTDLQTVLDALKEPVKPDNSAKEPDKEGAQGLWWQGLVNALGPAVKDLVSKINDPSEQLYLNAVTEYNEGVLTTLPDCSKIHDSIAALISSNKYGLLQNMVKQGMMRLVVTEGEIETKITFSTWNSSTSGQYTSDKERAKSKQVRSRSGGILGFYRSRKKSKSRIVTVNTAKSYQRDNSGTRVDIFGRVCIKFKTDYAPLNG